MLTTRYPGLRRLFPPYNSRGSLLALWRRTGEPWDSDPDLVFYRDLAAFCLVDNDITRKMEGTPPRQLGCVEENDSVVTTLLAEIATRLVDFSNTFFDAQGVHSGNERNCQRQ